MIGKQLSQSSTEVLSDIPVKFDFEKTLKRLKINSKTQVKQKELIRKLLSKKDTGVDIGGVWFKSRVLRKNLDKVERVFPYIATIGKSLEEKATSTKDLLEQYYLEDWQTGLSPSKLDFFHSLGILGKLSV